MLNITGGQRPRLTWREDLATVGAGTWLILGLFVDGWAHNTSKPESFFTPWHGLFYSGFAACAVWICAKSLRRGQSPRTGAPVGYGLGLVGVAVFAVGGVADLVWHELFGIEVNLEALFSPSHLMLFVGAFMVVSSPLRSAWHDPAGRSPSFRPFFPALLSVTLVTALTSFFLMALSPFVGATGGTEVYRFLADQGGDLGPLLAEQFRLVGLASFLIATVVLMGPTLMLARRWRLPAGSLTVLYVTVAALMAGVNGFRDSETVLAAVVGGVVADVLAARVHPYGDRPGPLRTVGAVVPAVMWLAYFGSLAVFSGVGWSVELWAGITVMSSLAGFGLALLMVPPALPPDPSPSQPPDSEPQLQAVNVA